MLGQLIKDPAAVLDYGVDWRAPDTGPWLSTGENIVTSTWTVPAGLTKNSDSHDGSITTIWLSGGTAGQTYALTNRVTTNQGRTDERTIAIVCHDR